jgi:hypothetical protein
MSPLATIASAHVFALGGRVDAVLDPSALLSRTASSKPTVTSPLWDGVNPFREKTILGMSFMGAANASVDEGQ